MMTIREYLKDHSGEYVKIGFGSAFVYCDKITAETPKKLEELTEVYLEQFYATREEASNRIENYLSEGRNRYIERRMIAQRSEYNHLRIEAKVFNRPFKYKKISSAEFGRMYDQYLNDAEKMRKKAERAILKFVPFLDAEVTELYNSLTEPAMIILSKDNRRVNGRYWTVKEYREECLKEKLEKENT